MTYWWWTNLTVNIYLYMNLRFIWLMGKKKKTYSFGLHTCLVSKRGRKDFKFYLY